MLAARSRVNLMRQLYEGNKAAIRKGSSIIVVAAVLHSLVSHSQTTVRESGNESRAILMCALVCRV